MDAKRLGEFEELILLAILRLEADAYAVTIQQCIVRHGRRPATMGAIYTGLDRLERKGMVTSALGAPTPQRGGRPKRFYHVTGVGKAALVEARQVRERMWEGLSPNFSG